MEYNPTPADMADAARRFDDATAKTSAWLEEQGLGASAKRVRAAIFGLSVRELAALHHFITIPAREG